MDDGEELASAAGAHEVADLETVLRDIREGVEIHHDDRQRIQPLGFVDGGQAHAAGLTLEKIHNLNAAQLSATCQHGFLRAPMQREDQNIRGPTEASLNPALRGRRYGLEGFFARHSAQFHVWSIREATALLQRANQLSQRGGAQAFQEGENGTGVTDALLELDAHRVGAQRAMDSIGIKSIGAAEARPLRRIVEKGHA